MRLFLYTSLNIFYLTQISAANKIDFARDIQPIFAAHCTQCHGPDKQNSGLNLTDSVSIQAKLKSGKRAIVRSQPSQSEILRRLTTNDTDELMPPPDKGQKLSAQDIAKIRQWIAEGAEWSVHWAYRPLQEEVPFVKNSNWIRNKIDHFVLTKLKAKNLEPAPPANRATLIKRLSYDLLGLPPTPAEVHDFINNKSEDAYETLIDRLLASPHFGERWGRHWLDKARYADSDGYEKDKPRLNAWRYRDWVINAINNDIPFDQFTIEQLGGDLLPESNDIQKLATAFNRQTLTNTEGGTDQEQWRVAAVMDRTETLGTVWLGLTVGCARCHNHKYDQVTQQEYYQLFAYFNNGDESSASVPRSRKDYNEWLRAKSLHDAHIKKIQANISSRNKTLIKIMPELEKRLLGEISPEKTNTERFHTMDLISVKGPKGVTFKKQNDNSLLATGKNPPKAEYTLEFKTDIKKITGIKIEVLPDKSLKANGPGRTDHGNFVLNDIRIYATDQHEFDSKKHRVTLSAARSDFSQKDWKAENAIDGKTGEGKNGTGWAISPQFGKHHHLIVSQKEPLSFKGTIRLQVVLDQQYGTKHTIGRFRITARTGQSPNNSISKEIVKAVSIEPEKRNKNHLNALLKFFRERDLELIKLQTELNKAAPKPPVMSVRVITQRTTKPRTTHVLHRGEFKQPKAKVFAGTLSTLPPVKHRAQGDRLDLARWLVNGKNPITPRVTINQIWACLFGEGIVRTPNDFGLRGDAPTHPELLDWLASEFIRRNWSRKAIIKLIATSATYRQSSARRPKMEQTDTDNRLLHRQNRFRVEAEIIRDLNLAASGLLSHKIGGTSVFPPLPSGVTSLSYANSFKWNTSKAENRYRRGMYTFFKRTAPHPNLLTFDCPDSNITCVQRSRSNTPLAALTTLNNEVFSETAKALGKRLIKEKPNDYERIIYGFLICTARSPSENEHSALNNLLIKARTYYEANKKEAITYNGDVESSAWAATARVLLNMDEFITRE